MLRLLSSAVWGRRFGQLEGPRGHRAALAAVKVLETWQEKLPWLREGRLLCHLCIHFVTPLFQAQIYISIYITMLCDQASRIPKTKVSAKSMGILNLVSNRAGLLPCPQLFSNLSDVRTLQSDL